MTQIKIRRITRIDHAEWLRLWSAYLDFYQVKLAQAVFASTWDRLFMEGEFEPKCLLATVDQKPVGLAHYLCHRSCWSLENSCYLQDLFTDAAMRGRGIGAALLEAVCQDAAKLSVANPYWMTHESNVIARRLYERVAKRTGFIEYAALDACKSQP